MKTGKISDSILKRSVLKKCTVHHPDVLRGAGPGSDYALLDSSESESLSCAVHTAVLFAQSDIRHEVEHAMNNLACSGCMTTAVMISLLLPQDAQEQELKQIMEKIAEVCALSHTEIAGGHTEVSAAVSRPVLTVTAIGMKKKQEKTMLKKAEPGMDLLMTGYAGLEGTVLLANAYGEVLLQKFPLDLVEQAKQLAPSIKIEKAALLALEAGAAAVHDLSQGGVFGALWEFCEHAAVGMETDLRKIPIRQETVEICEFFGLNPYQLRAGGGLLIAARDGAQIQAVLEKAGIPVKGIGRLTASKDRVFQNGSEVRYLDKPAQDEWFAFLERE